MIWNDAVIISDHYSYTVVSNSNLENIALLRNDNTNKDKQNHELENKIYSTRLKETGTLTDTIITRIMRGCRQGRGTQRKTKQDAV